MNASALRHFRRPIAHTSEVQPEFWWLNLWERDHLEDLRVGGRIILKWMSNRVGNGSICLRSGTSDGADLVNRVMYLRLQ